jgi:hypothetical protein
MDPLTSCDIGVLMVKNEDFIRQVILQWAGYVSDEGTIESRFIARHLFNQVRDSG